MQSKEPDSELRALQCRVTPAGNEGCCASSFALIQGFPLVTILAVDDAPNFLRALRAILEGEGYRVRTAHDAEAAMAIALADVPDVVVTDYMMPGVDGAAFCRRLKSSLTTVRIPVVVLTALYPPPSASETLWHAVLTKPVSVANLLRAVRALWDRTGCGQEPQGQRRLPQQ